MSPKSVQQKSIKDHFAIIPKKKVEPKIYPLFLKRKVTTKDKVETTTTTTTPPAPPPTPLAKSVPKSQPLKQEKKATTAPPKKRCSRAHPLQELINANSPAYFQKQKKLREGRVKEERKKPLETHQLFDQNSIENWMNEFYPKWKREPCCEYLFNNIPTLTNDNKIQWVNKYRPKETRGLIGYLPDFQYVTEWLDKIKVKSHSNTSESKKKTSKVEDTLYNLILFIGDHGSGKTATAYTVAQEMGYNVFEINSTSRRTGKDILNQVGEMTASHLVRFNQRKRKIKGEVLILRDTVVNKRPKTIDIATHFKRMLTVSAKTKDDEETKKESGEKEDVEPQKENTAREDLIVKEDVVMKEEKITKSGSLDSFFSKSSVSTTLVTESKTLKDGVTMTETVKDESKVVEEEEDILMEDVPKQSLVLLEEVDLLFGEDKGFWTAVIELCQKSKRPIIMTCNDESKIPFDYLNIESKIYFDLPEKSSLLPYLQLLCFSEKYIVTPYDIECLCELYNYDTRRIISTLQLYLNPHSKDEYVEYPALFAHIMGFSDLIEEESTSEAVVVLMDRLKGSSEKMKALCTKYYYHLQSKEEDDKEMGIDTICEMMETASFADAWIGLTDRQRHQIYDIDQYDDETDMIVSTNDNFIYKNATDLDHWELGEIIENSISVMNLNRKSIIWSYPKSAWSSHWEHLYDTSLLVNCVKKSVCPLVLSYPYYVGSLAVFMMEYLPNIRSICLNDDKASATTRRTRKKRSRYIKLDDESRDIINWQQI